MKHLLQSVEDTFTKASAMRLITCTNEIIRHCEQNSTGRIDPAMISTLKQYYSGVPLEQLVLLWQDNYNTMMLPCPGEPETGKSSLVRNKVMAIGSLITEKMKTASKLK